jgi:hypothetical protein
LIRFCQNFVLVFKLSLRRQLGELSINKKYKVWTSVSLQGELYLNAFHHFFRVLDSLQCTIDDALKYVLPYPGRMIGTHLPNELFFQKNLIWKMLVLGYIFQYSFIFSIKKKLKKINFLKFWHFFFGIILCQTCYLATVFGYHINNL